LFGTEPSKTRGQFQQQSLEKFVVAAGEVSGEKVPAPVQTRRKLAAMGRRRHAQFG
jgi:hypothetical protein